MKKLIEEFDLVRVEIKPHFSCTYTGRPCNPNIKTNQVVVVPNKNKSLITVVGQRFAGNGPNGLLYYY